MSERKLEALIKDLSTTSFGNDVLDAAVLGCLTTDMIFDLCETHGLNPDAPSDRHLVHRAINHAIERGN